MAPKIFCVIMAALMILSFGRAVLGAPLVDVNKIMLTLEEFEIQDTIFYQELEALTSLSWNSRIHKWNSDLGFFENLQLIIVSFTNWLIDIVWRSITSIIGFFLSFTYKGIQLWKLFFTLLGII